jgi:hypothetical protein
MKKVLLIIILALFLIQNVIATPAKPTKSKYFTTENAGFLLKDGEGVLYMIDLLVRKKIRKDMHGTAIFENPIDITSPLEFNFILNKGDKSILIRSPIINEIKNVKSYSVKVQLYKDSDKTKLVNTHLQMIEFLLPTEIADKKGINLIAAVDKPLNSDEINIVGWSIILKNSLWKKSTNQIEIDQSLIEYTPIGEALDNCSTIISSHIIYTNIELDWLYDFMIKELKKDCPTLNHNILKESNDQILFEWNHSGCRGEDAKHEIRKIANANNFSYSLSISWKNNFFSLKDKTMWVDKIKSANPVF